MSNQELIAKYKEYSTIQLQLLSSRLEGSKKEIVDTILVERYEKLGKKYTPFTNNNIILDKPSTNNIPKIKKKIKKNSSTAIITSELPLLQNKIDALSNQIGDDLSDSLKFLKENNIDIEFISFINVGDEVTFLAGKNSKQKFENLVGKVIAVSTVDKHGKRYCKIKENKTGKVFCKQQINVTRTK